MDTITFTKFISENGISFDNRADCILHEECFELSTKIKSLLKDDLVKSLTTIDFANGEGFIQLTFEDFNFALNLYKTLLLKIFTESFSRDRVNIYIAKNNFEPLRLMVLDNINSRYFVGTAFLFSSINIYSLRRYGQPYFAHGHHNPSSTCLNK